MRLFSFAGWASASISPTFLPNSDTFGVEGGREFREENPPVKGAGVVVACAEGFQPLEHALVAQVVAAG